MFVDPADECTFWYAQEYYTAASQAGSSIGWLTRIGSFKYPSCTPPAKGSLAGTVTRCADGVPLADASILVEGAYFRLSTAAGGYVMDLPPGTHDIAVSHAGFTTVVGQATVVAGQTTIFNACFGGTATLSGAGASLTAESCLPGNGVIDPGETVTVSFCVKNTGTVNTANLEGVLQETGGVAESLAPADFGVVVAGGADVCAEATFTAGHVACGSPVVATLVLRDGLVSYGAPSFNFPNGNPTCCTPMPAALQVDVNASVPTASLNKVWEPGETVLVEPSFFNGNTAALALTGTASNLTGPAATYTITDSSADYGSISAGGTNTCTGAGCYAMSVNNPASRPAAHWDATFNEALSNGAAKTWTLHVGGSFADVPEANPFYSFVETIFHKGVTGGCAGGGYCPGNPALRKQMAVFLLKSRFGAAYVPPAAAGIFADLPQADLFAPWVEDLYNRGITGGCSPVPLNFCPNNTVVRQQMAVFLLKTLEGSSYTPPPCTGLFGDVACPGTFANWIEELSNRAITSGCGGGNFCPGSPNTRGQMAVFLTKTFGLLLYGP